MSAAAASMWDVAGVVTGTSFSMDIMSSFFISQTAVIRASRLRRAEEHGL